MANAKYRPRGDTAANWTSANPVLGVRELGLETDTRKIKIGDGTTAWTGLSYMSAAASVSGPLISSGFTMATARLIGRTTAATGAPEELTVATVKGFLALVAGDITGLGYFATGTDAANLTGTVAAARMPALTGDVTTSAGAVATTIAAGVVSNSKLATMATMTIKGNNTGSTAAPVDLTAAQVRTVLGVVPMSVGTSAPGSPATNDLWVDTN